MRKFTGLECVAAASFVVAATHAARADYVAFSDSK